MIKSFTTPGGRPVQLECRPGTTDFRTCSFLLNDDEYGLKNLGLVPGFALDVGAYIGTLSVALALDGWAVVAAEPIPENVQMIERNQALNGVMFTIIPAVSHVRYVDVAYGFANEHHWVGNEQPTGPKKVRVEAWDLDGLGDFDLIKIDCEGCEWGVLAHPAITRVPVIVGEIHGRPQNDLVTLLRAHEVTFISEFVFQAVLR